ncbi:MAG: hypothetical protein K2X27_25475 [Candidatus Obscuribacterales bacterium]|nr:hypothetical protein [Candidatus Obscuribacterales bacterium]
MAVIPSDRQGLVKLNTGDTLNRIHGADILRTANGDELVVKGESSTLNAPGAKVEWKNPDTGRFEKVSQLPGEYG